MRGFPEGSKKIYLREYNVLGEIYFWEKEESYGGNENTKSGLLHKMAILNDIF